MNLAVAIALVIMLTSWPTAMASDVSETAAQGGWAVCWATAGGERKRKCRRRETAAGLRECAARYVTELFEYQCINPYPSCLNEARLVLAHGWREHARAAWEVAQEDHSELPAGLDALYRGIDYAAYPFVTTYSDLGCVVTKSKDQAQEWLDSKISEYSNTTWTTGRRTYDFVDPATTVRWTFTPTPSQKVRWAHEDLKFKENSAKETFDPLWRRHLASERRRLAEERRHEVWRVATELARQAEDRRLVEQIRIAEERLRAAIAAAARR